MAAEFLAVIDGPDDLPGLSKVAAELKVYAPAVMFTAGGAEDGAVFKLDWLILHRAKQVADGFVFAQFPGGGPGFCVIC